MNPFDLRGPEFLLFYFIFSAIVLLILRFLRQRDERLDVGKPPLDDPYLIAFLRDGEKEAIRVATLSLIDRGLLTIKSSGTSNLFPGGPDRLEMKDAIAIDTVKRPIEKCVLDAFKTAQPISSTLDSLIGSTACVDYAVSLEKLGLLPGLETRSARRRRFMIALWALLGVAGFKIVVALSRGHTNILFLIILAGLATYVTSRTSNPFRTARGERLLEDVKSLFSSLHLRAASLRPGGGLRILFGLLLPMGSPRSPPSSFHK